MWPSYFDRAGRPLGLLEWWRLMNDPDYQRVARDELEDGTIISTVWLGLNHQYGAGPPLIFETMVFLPNGDDEDQDRYATEEEALAGHRAMVAKWSTPSFTVEDILRGRIGPDEIV